MALCQLMRGVYQDWVAEAISPQRLAQECAFGFTLMAMPYATAETAPRLQARITELERALRGA